MLYKILRILIKIFTTFVDLFQDTNKNSIQEDRMLFQTSNVSVSICFDSKQISITTCTYVCVCSIEFSRTILSC